MGFGPRRGSQLVRIIAGKFGSRQITAPKGSKTHPMSERARGALFNALGDLDGKTVWDAFAGSGALALEAISRGASQAVATEKDRKSYRVLASNVIALDAKNCQAVRASCKAWGKTNPQARFDLILCDPPYHDMQLSTISALTSYLKPKGLMVVSYSGREPVPNVNGVVVVDNRNYGDAALAYYRLDTA